MVWVVVRVRELNTECGYEEEVGGSRDVVFAENVEGTMDGEADKPGSATDENTSRTLLTTIRKIHVKYIGHVLRGRSLEKDCLLGMVEGSRARGRQRMKYMDGLKTLMGCRSVGEVIRLAEGRENWRRIVAHVIEDTALR